MLKPALVTFIGVSVFFLACAAPATSMDSSGDESDIKSEPDATESCSSGGSIEAQDPSKLEKCECKAGGKARCLAKSKIPASFAAKLDECDDDGVCVPDSIIKSGGAAPKTCDSVVGEGRCMSLCVPEVAAKKGVLNRGKGDACESDELCVPCVNPLEGNKPTGVCEIGKAKSSSASSSCKSTTTKPTTEPTTNSDQCPYKGTPIDTSKFPACGEGGRCVAANLVPAGQSAKLEACSGGLCAPEKSVAAAGKYLPKACRSVNNAEGRCLSKVIKDVKSKEATLPRADCDANELCAPCFNPIDGTDTGACSSVSCDKPKEKPVSFATCCEGKGKCVPEGQVSDPEQKKKLSSDGCKEDVELCAPAEDIGRTQKRPTCSGTMKLLNKAYTGACVSNCLDLGIKGFVLDQGSCDGDHKCAPCTDPLGRNTGACD